MTRPAPATPEGTAMTIPAPAADPDRPVPYALTPRARAALHGTAPAPATLWRHVATLVAWLDAAHPRTEHEIACRVMKLAEETGEAVAAYIGMTGQNPRKGICATRDDLASELCDVIVTALVALATIAGDGDPEAIMQAHLSARFARLLDRIGGEPVMHCGCGYADCSACAGYGWACLRCGAAFFGAAPQTGLCPDCSPGQAA
jgi:hypothetical protein